MKNSILFDVIWGDSAELSDKIDRINKIAAPGVLTSHPADTVTISSPSLVPITVYGGCLHKIDGFHVAGGCATQRLVAKSAKLSSYLGDYFEGQDPFIKFQYIERGLPESWWEFAIGFFSFAGKTMFPPITIPDGTELFRVSFQVKDDILPETAELVCADEYFYTHEVQRRRDLTYTYSPQGFTKVECISGKFTVL